MLWIGVIALLAVAQSGCARLLNSYDVAPNGLQRSEYEFRRYLAAGMADSAMHHLPKDELLRLLFEGVAAHYAADYTRSAGVFDRASLIAEDRTTKSISKAALSLMVNDMSLAYEPSRTERLLLPYYAALGYVNAGKYEEAAIEARRLSSMLQVLQDKEDAPPRHLEAFFRYFAGTMFEIAGENADADVAYRNAFALDSTSLPLRATPASDSADVVLLIEHGYAPHRVQESLLVMLGDHETHQLDGSRSEDERRRASSNVAARVMEFASNAGPRTGPPRSRTLRVPPPSNIKASTDERCDSACEKHEDHSYLLRLSWPVMYAPAYRAPRISVDTVDVAAFTHVAIADGVLDDFRREQPAIVARAIARAATKYLIGKSAEDEIGKKNEALGDVVGAIANIAGAVSEQADTRSWHLLPGTITVVRMTMAPGTHRLRVDGADVWPIDVVAGRTNVISRRVWSN